MQTHAAWLQSCALCLDPYWVIGSGTEQDLTSSLLNDWTSEFYHESRRLYSPSWLSFLLGQGGFKGICGNLFNTQFWAPTTCQARRLGDQPCLQRACCLAEDTDWTAGGCPWQGTCPRLSEPSLGAGSRQRWDAFQIKTVYSTHTFRLYCLWPGPETGPGLRSSSPSAQWTNGGGGPDTWFVRAKKQTLFKCSITCQLEPLVSLTHLSRRRVLVCNPYMHTSLKTGGKSIIGVADRTPDFVSHIHAPPSFP